VYSGRLRARTLRAGNLSSLMRGDEANSLHRHSRRDLPRLNHDDGFSTAGDACRVNLGVSLRRGEKPLVMEAACRSSGDQAACCRAGAEIVG
jgi:hypothetical protein